MANEELATEKTETYYSCCGKSICCTGCLYSCIKSGNYETCPFCKSERIGRTNEEKVGQIMKRVEANDAGAMCVLGNNYDHGGLGLQQDRDKAMELWKQAAELGSIRAHFSLSTIYREGGDHKMARLHYEAAAMAGHEMARNNLGTMEAQSGNVERAVKHWTIAASVGDYSAMHNLLCAFNQGLTSRASIDSSLTLTAYNNSCVEMRSEARDAFIQCRSNSIGGS